MKISRQRLRRFRSRTQELSMLRTDLFRTRMIQLLILKAS